MCVWEVYLLCEMAERSVVGCQLNGTMISLTVTDSVNFTLQCSSVKEVASVCAGGISFL